jgi:predicted polyphosphate/ATP-dependent NAD kinase
MKIGFVVNPLAGIGGPVALKGSDGSDIVEQALARGAQPKAAERARVAMDQLVNSGGAVILTAGGSMGEAVLDSLGLPCEVVYEASGKTSAKDTAAVIAQFAANNVDLIVFAGGDGTARDVLDALYDEAGSSIPVIGIPAGVKIHSAVYAVTPLRAGELIRLIVEGEPVSLHEAEVMDLDERAFREGEVKARCYGYLTVPVDDTRMQLMKQGGLNYHDMALQDIASDVIESMLDDVYYIIASGSTTAEIMNQLHLENTLLGVDIICNQQVIVNDADEREILQIVNAYPVKIILSIIGGQGHVFGRGNQQLSAEVISHVIDQPMGRDNIIIIATNEKLRSLEKRPMIADTGDAALDKKLSGLYPVITGYQQKTLYKLN